MKFIVENGLYLEDQDVEEWMRSAGFGTVMHCGAMTTKVLSRLLIVVTTRFNHPDPRLQIRSTLSKLRGNLTGRLLRAIAKVYGIGRNGDASYVSAFSFGEKHCIVSYMFAAHPSEQAERVHGYRGRVRGADG